VSRSAADLSLPSTTNRYVTVPESTPRLGRRRPRFSRACTLHRHWPRLLLFLEDGRIELTNNHAERELRRLVLGRKNWLFASKDIGGQRAATMLTIFGSCIAQGVRPREYLHELVKRLLAGWPQAKLRELLPDRLVLTAPTVSALPAPTNDQLAASLAG